MQGLELTAAALVVIVLVGAIVVAMLLWFIPVRLWIQAWFSGVRIDLGTLVGMRLRKVSPPAVVRPLIAATKAGLRLSIHELETVYMAGGNVDAVVGALISADKVGMSLSFAEASAIDLAGLDVGNEVKQRIAVASGEAHEMACPHCGRLFEIDRHILTGFVESLRDYPPFQELMRTKR